MNVSNTTKHDIILNKRTVLGTLKLVKSVTPQEVRLKESRKLDSKPEFHDNGVIRNVKVETDPEQKSEHVECIGNDLIDDIDLRGLTEQQQKTVRTMLLEEIESFSSSDEDIGCIEDLTLKLNMRDTTPVQKTYNSIPRPLYPEVKQYIEDLLNRGWITKSKSPYSSPVVCVRKKNGDLRLCVDYRELNKRTIPNRHPLPRIQDTLDSLGGNSWFSLVDQGKAYHQGFMEVESRPMTAFVTP